MTRTKPPTKPSATKTPTKPAKHAGGRPKGKVPTAPVTGFRVPLDVLADLDAVVEDLSTGAVTASRTSVVVEAIRAFVAKHRAGKVAGS